MILSRWPRAQSKSSRCSSGPLGRWGSRHGVAALGCEVVPGASGSSLVSGRFWTMSAAAVLAALGLLGCGKGKADVPVSAAADTQEAALPGAQTGTALGASSPQDRAKLAQWFAPVRCQALGMALPNPGIYAEAGFGSAAEFAAAFDAAAAADPTWARQVVAKAYATPCPDGKAGTAALPRPVTATSGENR